MLPCAWRCQRNIAVVFTTFEGGTFQGLLPQKRPQELSIPRNFVDTTTSAAAKGETKGNKNLARHKGGSRPLQPLRLSNLNRRDGNPVHKICPLAIILPSIMCLWWHQSHVRLPAQPPARRLLTALGAVLVEIENISRQFSQQGC